MLSATTGTPLYVFFEFLNTYLQQTVYIENHQNSKSHSLVRSTSARLRSVDRFGRSNTSLKSNFGSKSILGMMRAQLSKKTTKLMDHGKRATEHNTQAIKTESFGPEGAFLLVERIKCRLITTQSRLLNGARYFELLDFFVKQVSWELCTGLPLSANLAARAQL
jgi:hypothetical protein